MIHDLVVIGGGAGGCFAAIRLGEMKPRASVVILEAARKPLSKVEISGGGRCNVTHACFDAETLVKYYPRGGDFLRKPFKRFQPADMLTWLEGQAVELKTEADGRVFPVTDTSSTIINCFLNRLSQLGIELNPFRRVVEWKWMNKYWQITVADGRQYSARNLLIATGSDSRTWKQLASMGHTIVPPVPSLFTFNIGDKVLNELQGISVPDARVEIPSLKMTESGPLLLTHWGISGPAVIKLSAWAARELYDCGYVFDVKIGWLNKDLAACQSLIEQAINESPKKQIHNLVVGRLPSRLWKYLCERSGIPEKVNGSEVGKKAKLRLAENLSSDIYRVIGKSTYKDEFVTAGGVDLNEMKPMRFESKLHPHLFLVGEVLNIDALTGGFNFQAAWTGAELVASAIAGA